MLELLVVIAVILLLAALLLPALTTARSRALKAGCISNLRQVGTALSLYVQEQGFFPLATSGDGLGSCPRSLRPVAGATVLCCPQKLKATDKLLQFFPTNTLLNPPYGYNFIGGVWSSRPLLNLGLGGDYAWSDSGGTYLPAPENRIQVPAQMIALGDTPALLPPGASPPPGATPGDLLWISYPYIFPGADVPGVGTWHNGGANMAFCDGHVQYAKQSVWMKSADDTRRLWNNDNLPHEETW
jgi:prepilin-type processing-associated H-X9-DG protein